MTRRGDLLAAAGVGQPEPSGAVVLTADVMRALADPVNAVLGGSITEVDGAPWCAIEQVSPLDGAGEPAGDRPTSALPAGPVWPRVGVVTGRAAPRPDDLVLTVADGARLSATWRGARLRVVVRDPARYRDRVLALPDADAIADRTVLIVGLGSVGSDLGARLARLGVRVVGVDHDHLAVENLIRWGLVVPLSQVGRAKARVFAETLTRLVPGARVEGHRMQIVGQAAEFDRLLAGVRPDLLVVATDTRDSRIAVNAAAGRHGLPALYIALADGASSVRIEVVADARRGPCHLCSSAAETGPGSFADEARSATTPYATGVDSSSEAVPALPVDVGIGTALASRIALTMLAGGDPSPWFRHGEQHGNVLFVALRPDTWVLTEAWQRLSYAPERQPGCPVCGGEPGPDRERTP